MMLFIEIIRSAFRSIWSNKVQSALAILGVVIGVSSVTILVSLGQGLKNDVSNLIQGFGTNVIFITTGKIDTNSTNSFSNTNPANFISGDILTLEDHRDIETLPEVEAASPITLVSGTVKRGEKVSTPQITGVYPSAKRAFQILEVDRGAMFESSEAKNVILLGKTTVKELFGDEDPIGKTVRVADRELTVIGTTNTGKTTSIFGSEFDSMALIPFDLATAFNKNNVNILRIAVKVDDNSNVEQVKQTIHTTLLKNHNQEEDFSVLTQEDLLGLFTMFLDLATTLVSAIAAISLIVGGIGIMNIMLLTVTERTREIGLRKAVGASKKAILLQFLTESLVITVFGGLLGLSISVVTAQIIAAKTSLTPEITSEILFMAVGISGMLGVIFGLWPAFRAANKDPIDALRYE